MALMENSTEKALYAPAVKITTGLMAYVTPEVKQALHEEARRRNVSASEVVRQALEKELAKE